MNALITSQALTMSSREIAAVVNSRHDSVKRTMERLRDKGVISITPLVEPQEGGGKPLTSYLVNKRNSYIVVAQISPEFTAVLVDRWQALENSVTPKLPSTKELALMVIKAEEEKEQAMIEVDRLQGVCNTITAQFATGMTATKFCKTLNGVNTQQVNNTLIEMGKLRRTDKGIVPVAYTRDKYFKEVQEEHNGKLRCHSTLTLIGAKWLYRAYLSGKLPMKANWDKVNSHVVF